MNGDRPHLVLLGGVGGRSGVPRHIEQICRVLQDDYTAPLRISVISEPDAGGYGFTGRRGVAHIGLPAMASSANPLHIVKGWNALRKALKQEQPNIVWAHARLPVILARLMPFRKTPLIITYHGSPFLGRSAKTARFMWWIEAVLLQFAPRLHIVFLSSLDHQSFAGLPLHRHTCHVIPNVAPPLNVAPIAPAQAPTLIMTTRDSPQKNLDAAARIFGALPENFRLILLGMGTDSAVLKSRFATILPPSALERISFQGQMADVAPALRRAHGYLMTSHYEGMSLGALEAFAAGLPVFIPDIGGSGEILAHHPMAARIDPKQPEQAAKVILPILHSFQANPVAHSTAISAAYAAGFSPMDWGKQVKGLLQEALSGQSTNKILD